MKLNCYLMDRPPLSIRPAPLLREWMEKTPDRYAYRCLPLNIGNSHGWEVCCDESFDAVWNGGNQINDIHIPSGKPAISHFGSGILTFHVACIFETEPGWNLFVMGPPNAPKRGIYPLTGVIETDWAPYSFTMNWIFTEPNHVVHFQKGEPFCFFFPVPRGMIETVEPAFRDMRSNPELLKQHTDWIQSRHDFLKNLKDPHSDASKAKWQRRYFRGEQMTGEVGLEEHQTKLRPKAFVNKMGVVEEV